MGMNPRSTPFEIEPCAPRASGSSSSRLRCPAVDPITERAKLAPLSEKNLSSCGAHLTLSGPVYGTESVLLLCALRRFPDDPAASGKSRAAVTPP